MRARGHRLVRQAEENVTAGLYSPMPPARTGVADYAAALLRGLRKCGPVEVAPEHCDAALYHVGNNEQHAEIYQRALARPGVVVLHDAVLHHFLLGRLSEREYVDEFVYNYGGWKRSLAGDLWRGRAAAGSDTRYFQYAMLKRVATTARAIVVHNPGAGRIVQEHAAETPVVEIPHLFEAPEVPGVPAVRRYRQQLGFADNGFVFGVFGYIRETKRLIQILDAFAAARRQDPRLHLLVAGDFASAELQRAADAWMQEPGISRVPYLKTSDFWLAASAVDACVNLRYPGAGETSGIAIRLMGIGKPVMLSDSEENARFPEDACIRIPSGVPEREALVRHMLLLPSREDVGRAIGQHAADMIRTQHSLERVARQYWDTLCAYRC